MKDTGKRGTWAAKSIRVNLFYRRALPGENQVQTGAGAPPVCNLTRNWASGIPPLNQPGVMTCVAMSI